MTAPIWPPVGTIERYIGYDGVAEVAFTIGKTGRIVLVRLGNDTNGEAIDKRIPLLGDLYHRMRESAAMRALARLRERPTLEVVVADGYDTRVLDSGVALIAAMGLATEFHEELALARQEIETGSAHLIDS